MARFIKDRIKAQGQVPGSLVFIGNQKMEAPIIQIMQYDADKLVEKNVDSIEEAYSLINPSGVNWINIYGLHDMELVAKLGKLSGFSTLLLEDMVNTDQRPKYEDEENVDAFILKMLRYEKKDNRIHAEQISIILGENYVLTLQERVGDVFLPVRERIRQKRGRIRTRKNDYLAYALMDIIVDNYTFLIENIGSRVEELEDRIFAMGDAKIVEEIYLYKTELNYLRKTVRPVKDLMTALLRSESSYFEEGNKKFLGDLNDLVIQSTDAIELYNNLVSEQLNIYNSNISNRMNEVMKVLTIFASIFIPLTFLAGIYGMNFDYIPELGFKYSYLIFWMVVLAMVGGMLYYFKRKNWF
ncbi:magnesium/cobalt transporter CorA [Prolixibacteraceae bacterium Z1-6]|uniref:Magnesium transport protein CorA n=1 Tax=Draconibacterium aestuarii TaxID=2998507 RepID=A0A9X3FBS2_9BACT|nr:magnesium/cobalt transporter CorA [Prolixibacteraceae bacterium Z1-6]